MSCEDKINTLTSSNVLIMIVISALVELALQNENLFWLLLIIAHRVNSLSADVLQKKEFSAC